LLPCPGVTPAISVVIPACGKLEPLLRCLAALGRQSIDRKQFEVIVVDDSEARLGAASARDQGWRRARAPIVAFTDAGVEPDERWLENGLAAFTDGIDALAGRVIGAPLERAAFSPANCMCRKDLLVDAGGFDEAFELARMRHAPSVVVAQSRRAPAWQLYAIAISFAGVVGGFATQNELGFMVSLIAWVGLGAEYTASRLSARENRSA
jgi:hypothetical protein